MFSFSRYHQIIFQNGLINLHPVLATYDSFMYSTPSSRVGFISLFHFYPVWQVYIGILFDFTDDKQC